MIMVAGHAAMTVDAISADAGISRRTFYELYPSARDAFAEMCDCFYRELVAAVDAACTSGGVRESRVASVLGAVGGLVVERSAIADAWLTYSGMVGDRDGEVHGQSTQELRDRVAGYLRTAGRPRLSDIVIEVWLGRVRWILLCYLAAPGPAAYRRMRRALDQLAAEIDG